jgi:hypothetical protein
MSYTVERRHSGTEDGPLWYVIAPDGSPHDSGGWLYREDAEHDAAHLNGTPCECGGAFERHDHDIAERDTLALLGHPFYDRDSEATGFAGGALNA